MSVHRWETMAEARDDIAQIARGKSSFPFTNYHLQEISDGITERNRFARFEKPIVLRDHLDSIAHSKRFDSVVLVQALLNDDLQKVVLYAAFGGGWNGVVIDVHLRGAHGKPAVKFCSIVMRLEEEEPRRFNAAAAASLKTGRCLVLRKTS
jgi:hypothetical protein